MDRYEGPRPVVQEGSKRFVFFEFVSYLGLSLVISYHWKYHNTAHDAHFIELAARDLLHMGHLIRC